MSASRLAVLVVSFVVSMLQAAYAGELTEFKGLWQSQGYNLALAIDDEHFVLYELTPISRLRVAEGDLVELERELGNLQFDQGKQHLTALDPTSIAPIVFDRIEQLPGPIAGRSDSARDAKQWFDIVWHTFNDNYAFFELRGVDWNAQRKLQGDKIRSDSTDAELFEAIAALVGTLRDNHVELRAEGFEFTQPSVLLDFPLVRHWRQQHSNAASDLDFLTYARQQYYKHVTTNAELVAAQMTGPVRRGANDMLMWGRLPGEIGYLRIEQMAGYLASDAPPQEHLQALDKTLDRVMEDFKDAPAMIVDVRFNGGGWDPAAVHIANRFADAKRAAFSKKARTAEGFTPKHTVYVQPAGARQFTRPTLLLTSPLTASAAEIFTFCMKALPHVKQAGLPTMGIHSDMLVRHLPNDWAFSLSNEVYEFIDGNVYEKVGIPPDIEIPMFEVTDHADDKDQVLLQAIDYLVNKSQER